MVFILGPCLLFLLSSCMQDDSTSPNYCGNQYELSAPAQNCATNDAIPLLIGDTTTIPAGENAGVKHKYLLYLRNNYYRTLFENSIWVDDLTGGIELNSLILDFVVFKRVCYEETISVGDGGGTSSHTVCNCSTYERPNVQSIKITAINPLNESQRQIIGEVTQNTLDSSGRLSFQIPASLPDFKPWFSIVPGKDYQPIEIEIIYTTSVVEPIDIRLYAGFCLIK